MASSTGACTLMHHFNVLFKEEDVEDNCVIPFHMNDSEAVLFLTRPYVGRTARSADAPAVEVCRLLGLTLSGTKMKYKFTHQKKPDYSQKTYHLVNSSGENILKGVGFRSGHPYNGKTLMD